MNSQLREPDVTLYVGLFFLVYLAGSDGPTIYLASRAKSGAYVCREYNIALSTDGCGSRVSSIFLVRLCVISLILFTSIYFMPFPGSLGLWDAALVLLRKLFTFGKYVFFYLVLNRILA